MIKYCLLFFCYIIFSICAYSQTQMGYVKTLGRPDKKGVSLSGVSVRVKGEHNPVLSQQDGTFSMLMTGKRNGDAYSLQEVKKKGYELNENGVIGRQYAYSDRVPLTIVMVSSAQLQADKQRIENNAYKVAEKNYKAKLELLERQKAESTITEEQYRKELLDLQDKFEKYQLLIDGLAEHYAHVDYDELDDKEREINIYIENGELERADSLIKTLFDPIDVLKRNKEALAQLNQQISEANNIIDKANEDMAAVLKQQERDAEYLYQLYTIALAKFDNELARKYIETRAALDTTNVKWQMDAGAFMDYIGQYRLAFNHYQRSLRYVDTQDSLQLLQSYLCRSRLGELYSKQGHYKEALKELEIAYHLCTQLGDNNLYEQIRSLNNIGEVYQEKGDLLLALNYYNQAITLLRSDLLKQQSEMSLYTSPSVAISICVIFMNWAEIERKIGKYNEAVNMLNELNNIYHLDEISDNYIYAQILNNLGMIYFQIDKKNEAEKYYQRSLTMYKNIFGEQHPSIALLYNNIGELYRSEQKASIALDYHQKSLYMRCLFYGNQHPLVAQSLSNLGITLNDLKKYEEAIPYFMKACQIYESAKKENNEDIASVENNLGMSLYLMNDFHHAETHFAKALSILEQHPSINYYLLATICGNLYAVNEKLNKKSLACSYRWKRLDYYGKLIESNDFYNTEYYRRDRALDYQELGDQYAEINDTTKLIECYNIAKDILSRSAADENKRYADIFMTKGSEELINQNLGRAEKYIRKALNIYIASYGETNKDVVVCLNLLSSICLGDHRLHKGKDYADKAVSIMESLYPEGSPDLYACYLFQSTFQLKLLTVDSQNFIKGSIPSQQLTDYGAEQCLDKMLSTVESFFPNDSEKLEATIAQFINLNILIFAQGDSSFGRKVKALAAKYPQHVKKVLENLQKQKKE